MSCAFLLENLDREALVTVGTIIVKMKGSKHCLRGLCVRTTEEELGLRSVKTGPWFSVGPGVPIKIVVKTSGFPYIFCSSGVYVLLLIFLIKSLLPPFLL